jgi:hypothetical protein
MLGIDKRVQAQIDGHFNPFGHNAQTDRARAAAAIANCERDRLLL